MRFNKLDLNLLVALDVLLKERSVTRAAERLHMSPSAISNSLSRLREYFDDDILTQVGRRLEITSLGESLQDPVRDVLNRIDSTILLQPTFEPEKTERVFGIFSSDYTQTVLAPHLLALAGDQNSSARFQFLPQVSNPHRLLEQGDADLLIIPEEFISRDHPYNVLYKEDFVCLMWKDSKIAKSELTLESYANAYHVMMRPSDEGKDYFEYLISKKYGINRNPIATTYSFFALPALVIGTEYIATVHARLARQVANSWPLVMKPLPVHIEQMKQCVQWHQYRTKDPGLVWLRDKLAEATKRMDKTIPVY